LRDGVEEDGVEDGLGSWEVEDRLRGMKIMDAVLFPPTSQESIYYFH
jgi:hypothetical protein